MEANELRRKVEQDLRRALPDAVWQLLVEDYYVGEVLSTLDETERKECYQSLLRRARRLLRLTSTELARTAPRTQKHSEDDTTADALAVSGLLALQASLEPSVRAFRARYGTISPEETFDWVMQRCGEGKWKARATEVVEHKIFITATAAREVRVLQADTTALPLFELWVLLESLTSRYGWVQEEALEFVLANTIPILRARATIEPYPIPTVTLRIPVWTPPARVAEIYQRARRRLSRRRFRPFTRRQAEAVFRACQILLRQPDASWEQLASQVGVPKPLLQKWWTRARQKLRRWLKPWQ